MGNKDGMETGTALDILHSMGSLWIKEFKKSGASSVIINGNLYHLAAFQLALDTVGDLIVNNFEEE